MRSRELEKSVRRRAKVTSPLALLPLVAFLTLACQLGITGLDPETCDTSSFTGFGGRDDQEDWVRCIERGVPITGDVAVGEAPADVPSRGDR